MSVLQDLLGGGSSGGGGGVPLGGLIETTKFMPELAGYKKANVRQTLLQSEFPDLYAAIGAQPDVAPQLSAYADDNDFNGELDHTLNTFDLKIDDGTNFGNPTSMYRATDDIWFAWVSSGIFYTTTGLDGTWAQLPGVSESASNQFQSMQGAYDPAGYVVLISDRRVLCNQTAGDYTSWTEYNLYNGSEYLKYIYYADGHFVIGFTTNYTNGWACVAWTDDPRFAANWTKHLNLFYYQGEQSHITTSRGQMAGFYCPTQDRHILLVGVHNYSASQNEMELWYNDDLVNNSTFTENTDFTAANVDQSSGYSMIFGPIWEASNGDIVWLCKFINILYVFIWDDCTGLEKRRISVNTTSNFSYQQYMIPVDIPEMNYPGQLFMWDAIVYGYHWDGSDFSSGRSDEYKMYYDSVELNWSSYGNARDMVQWDSVGKTMVCWAKPDTSQTGDYYLWRYPFYTYNTTTHFALRPIDHANSDVIYQTRVE